MTVALDKPIPLQQPPPPRTKRWTEAEYYQIIEKGAFRGQRVFLFRGEIFEMSPQLHPHAFAMTRLAPALAFLLGQNSGQQTGI